MVRDALTSRGVNFSPRAHFTSPRTLRAQLRPARKVLSMGYHDLTADTCFSSSTDAASSSSSNSSSLREKV